MTAKEMFKKLGYEQVQNDNGFITYKDDEHNKHEDGDYKYVSFNHLYNEYEVGYYNGYELTEYAVVVSIKEHEAITQQLKELGWS